jgi:hypothetical protein
MATVWTDTDALAEPDYYRGGRRWPCGVVELPCVTTQLPPRKQHLSEETWNARSVALLQEILSCGAGRAWQGAPPGMHSARGQWRGSGKQHRRKGGSHAVGR